MGISQKKVYAFKPEMLAFLLISFQSRYSSFLELATNSFQACPSLLFCMSQDDPFDFLNWDATACDIPPLLNNFPQLQRILNFFPH